jgi:acid stress chaperone HdeB
VRFWADGATSVTPIVFKRRVFLRMKKFFVLVFLASSFAAVAACAQDGKLDLATLTCQQLFEMKREQINIVLGWLQGYYLEENGPPVVDLDKLSADALRLSGYCRANPQEDVISAAEALFGK